MALSSVSIGVETTPLKIVSIKKAKSGVILEKSKLVWCFLIEAVVRSYQLLTFIEDPLRVEEGFTELKGFPNRFVLLV